MGVGLDPRLLLIDTNASEGFTEILPQIYNISIHGQDLVI